MCSSAQTRARSSSCFSLADGADAFVATHAARLLVAAQHARTDAGVPTVAEQVAAGRDDLTYANFLTWRSQLRRRAAALV